MTDEAQTFSRTKNSKTLLKDGGNNRAYVTAILKNRAWKRRSRTLMRGFWFMLGFRILLGPMLLLLLLRGTLLLLAWLSDMISGFPVLTLHTLTPDSRSAWLLTAQEARRRCTLHAAHTVGQNQQFSLLTDPDSLQPVTWDQQCTCSHDDSKKLPNNLISVPYCVLFDFSSFHTCR